MCSTLSTYSNTQYLYLQIYAQPLKYVVLFCYSFIYLIFFYQITNVLEKDTTQEEAEGRDARGKVGGKGEELPSSLSSPLTQHLHLCTNLEAPVMVYIYIPKSHARLCLIFLSALFLEFVYVAYLHVLVCFSQLQIPYYVSATCYLLFPQQWTPSLAGVSCNHNDARM